MRGPVITGLSALAVVIGILHGRSDHLAAAPPPEADAPADPKAGPKLPDALTSAGTPTVTPAAPAPSPKLVEARARLDAGDLAAAEGAYKGAIAGDLSAEDFADAQNGLAEIELYRALMEIVAEHPFASGEDLYEVVLPNGEQALARVPDARAERLELRIQDGRRLTVKRTRLQRFSPVSQREYEERVEKELKARREELGAKPNPVEVYRRLVAYGLENRRREEAFTALREALKQPSGGVLIDLFCDGDTSRYHIARARLAGITDLAMLDQIGARAPTFAEKDAPAPRDEPAPVSPAPTPREPKPSEAQPAPTTPKAGPRLPSPEELQGGVKKPAAKDANKILSDPRWIKADAHYREGLQVYRRSLTGSSGSVGAVIKEARERFEKAQEIIFELADAYPDDPTLERRAVEVQQLVYDCIKRQKV